MKKKKNGKETKGEERGKGNFLEKKEQIYEKQGWKYIGLCQGWVKKILPPTHEKYWSAFKILNIYYYKITIFKV